MEREKVKGLSEVVPEEEGANKRTNGPDEETNSRAQTLIEQAQAIAEAGGPDMLEVFRQDPVIRRKITSGEWDFQVALGYLLGRESAKAQGRKGVPQAVRSPNNANTRRGISQLSQKEFDELDERLSRGEIIDPGY